MARDPTQWIMLADWNPTVYDVTAQADLILPSKPFVVFVSMGLTGVEV